MTHQGIARSLRDAYAAGPIKPLRDGLAADDAAGAYAVQNINTAFWRDGGRRIVGRKIGLTAKAVQAQFGVDQPDYGTLFDDMQLADGGVLRADRVIQPRVEAEIALILARDIVDPAATAVDVAAATDCVMASIEIVDSRIADWAISYADTVADNGSAAFFVLGSDRHALDTVDLYSCGMVMEVNGEIASIGVGAACLGHPLNAAAWLAREMTKWGDPLKAGDIVLTGALGPMVAIKPGAKIVARVGGIGSASFNFEAVS